MTLDSKDARRALEDIQNAAEKSATLRGYVGAGIHLVIWGAVWVVGGMSSLISPEIGRWGWMAAVISGNVASIVVGMRATGASIGGGALMAKVVLTMATLVCVSAALALVLDVDNLREGTALQALLVAGAYSAFGIWRGARIAMLGVALGAGALIGWFYLGAYFEAFVGILGGAMLVLSGLWLRRA